MKDLLVWSVKQSLMGLAAAIFLIVAVALFIGPMMGIAWMMDHYSHWWGFAFIPYFLLMPILSKPLAAVFGE